LHNKQYISKLRAFDKLLKPEFEAHFLKIHKKSIVVYHNASKIVKQGVLFITEDCFYLFFQIQSLYSKIYFYYSYWPFHKLCTWYTFWLWSNQLIKFAFLTQSIKQL